jgi:hypothetical protein
MKSILFLLLCVFFGSTARSWGDIEIYANGHKYDSLQEYLASKKAVTAPSLATPASLDSQQAEDIRKAAQQMGINVDFKKVKTFQIGPKGSSSELIHRFYVLSVENGVVGALQDFYQNWGQSVPRISRVISSEQLQEAIQQAVSSSKDPKFLISEPGKVRIMALTVKDSTQ